MARCGANFRKPVQAITDRAKRYRAHSPGCKPDGPKVCAVLKNGKPCGSRRFIVIGHKDGDESNWRKSNLRWECKSCNTRGGKRDAKMGRGVRTRQYNPKMKTRVPAQSIVRHGVRLYPHTPKSGPHKGKTFYVSIPTGKNPGAKTLGAYVDAAVNHTRGAHDEGGKVIHETPKAKRREFAREIAFRKGNPELPASEKLSHAAVKYESPSRHKGQSCASYAHLIAASPLRCEGVQSPIKKPDWCKNFTPKKSGETPADKLYRRFHGRGPDRINTMLVHGIDPYGGHPELTALGPLIRLVVGEDLELDDDGKIIRSDGWVDEIRFVPSMDEYYDIAARLDRRNPQHIRAFRAWLQSNRTPDIAAVPDGNQIYIIGGNQVLTDDLLIKLGADPKKDSADLGYCYLLEYFDQKRFHSHKPTTYFHKLGEKSGTQPRVRYDTVHKLIFLDGGEYYIKGEWIQN